MFNIIYDYYDSLDNYNFFSKCFFGKYHRFITQKTIEMVESLLYLLSILRLSVSIKIGEKQQKKK